MPSPIIVSFIFLAINVSVLLIILRFGRPSRSPREEPPLERISESSLSSSEILGWEFEYARITASEAMGDRHTMVNFYLLISAVVSAGVVAIVNPENPGNSLPLLGGTILLWSLCGIGWFYFLKIIRLREAWHLSAEVMNKIKDFYIAHSAEFPNNQLGSAFLWRTHTLPPTNQSWNVFFYSAALIGFLDSLAYGIGGALMFEGILSSKKVPDLIWIMPFFALAFFFFHVWLYFALLKPKESET